MTRGFGPGHLTGVTAWMTFSVNTIVTAMVASSFGSYASAMFGDGNATATKLFAVFIVLAMSAVNIAGSTFVARAQTVVVVVVIGILLAFALSLAAPTLRAMLGNRRILPIQWRKGN